MRLSSTLLRNRNSDSKEIMENELRQIRQEQERELLEVAKARRELEAEVAAAIAGRLMVKEYNKPKTD